MLFPALGDCQRQIGVKQVEVDARLPGFVERYRSRASRP